MSEGETTIYTLGAVVAIFIFVMPFCGAWGERWLDAASDFLAGAFLIGMLAAVPLAAVFALLFMLFGGKP